jgi:GTPase SAR1 family protein
VKRLVALIGQPGSGKSTLVAALTASWSATTVDGPCPYLLYQTGRGQVAELGRRRDSFSGTDALSLSVQPKAVKLMAGLDVPMVLAEGDRLANESFWLACEEAGWDVRVVFLAVPDDIAAARRAERGSTQSAAWVRGRQTKVRRLAARWNAHRLDGRWPPDVLACDLWDLLTGL